MCEALDYRLQLYRERGLPNAIRSDNGVPFAFSRPDSRLSLRVQRRASPRGPRHEAPGKLYSASVKTYDGRLPELHYPLHGREVLITACGRT